MYTGARGRGVWHKNLGACIIISSEARPKLQQKFLSWSLLGTPTKYQFPSFREFGKIVTETNVAETSNPKSI